MMKPYGETNSREWWSLSIEASASQQGSPLNPYGFIGPYELSHGLSRLPESLSRNP
jgi:hypothetical protein